MLPCVLVMVSTMVVPLTVLFINFCKELARWSNVPSFYYELSLLLCLFWSDHPLIMWQWSQVSWLVPITHHAAFQVWYSLLLSFDSLMYPGLWTLSLREPFHLALSRLRRLDSRRCVIKLSCSFVILSFISGTRSARIFLCGVSVRR